MTEVIILLAHNVVAILNGYIENTYICSKYRGYGHSHS